MINSKSTQFREPSFHAKLFCLVSSPVTWIFISEIFFFCDEYLRSIIRLRIVNLAHIDWKICEDSSFSETFQGFHNQFSKENQSILNAPLLFQLTNMSNKWNEIIKYKFILKLKNIAKHQYFFIQNRTHSFVNTLYILDISCALTEKHQSEITIIETELSNNRTALCITAKETAFSDPS